MSGSEVKMDLYRYQPLETRWASFENPAAAKGQGGRENRGAKGHAFDSVKAGQTRVLLDVAGSGTLRRIWCTANDRSPRMLRALRLEAFWDGSGQPAISVPLGDFFGVGLGRRTAFENALFSDPEGRSFNAVLPMPFRTGARITLTNDSDNDLPYLFYDIDCTLGDRHDGDILYCHAAWRRERPNTLGRDYEILPRVQGRGRYLGANLGIMADPLYDGTWWGEGEVKAYLDGDGDAPTLVGTGTEDYIGTGWGQGTYAHRHQGCLIADREHRQWAFYRYHTPDPVYFAHDCRVTIQTIGGTSKETLLKVKAGGAPLRLVSVDRGGEFAGAFEQDPPLELEDDSIGPNAWCNFYRQDDWSATAYFYLDTPENGLPALAPVEERVAGLA